MASSAFAQPQSNVSGALTEVSAIRALESHLYCNPEGTLWAQQMQRVTNFAIGEVDTTFSGASNLTGWSELFLQAELQRAGDLIMDSEVCFTLGPLANVLGLSNAILEKIYMYVEGWTPAVGYAAIKNVELLIGQQKFNYHTRESLMMYDEIHKAEGRRSGMSIGDYGEYLRGAKVTTLSKYRNNPSAITPLVGGDTLDNPAEEADEKTIRNMIQFSTRTQNIIASLPFFYCQATGNALNIIGLQQHQVNVNLTLAPAADLQIRFLINRETGELLDMASVPSLTSSLPSATIPTMSALYLRSKYVYLDTMERRVMAQQPMTRIYVTEQIQEIPISSSEIVSGISNVKQSQNFFNLGVIDYSFAFRLDTMKKEYFNQYFSFGALRAKKQAAAGVWGNTADYYCQEMVSAIGSIAMQVNNYTRFNACDEYLRFDIPRKRASRTPTRIIQYYSFAVHASAADEAISGSFNLSAIDNVVFVYSFKPGSATGANDEITDLLKGSVYEQVITPLPLTIKGRIFVYARNYNVYKQAAGMIGSQFAN